MGWDREAMGRDTQHLLAKQDGQGQDTKDVEVEDADPWPDAASRKLEAATATCARWSVQMHLSSAPWSATSPRSRGSIGILESGSGSRQKANLGAPPSLPMTVRMLLQG